MEMRRLGTTDVVAPPMGVGTWAWGDRSVWGYGKGHGREEVEGAFRASLKAGVNFFDTAEVYGDGLSETILGALIKKTNQKVIVATKYAPYRLKAETLLKALDKSLERLGSEQVDLYQIHWYVPHVKIEALMDALAEAHKEGKVRAVGVSNYSAEQMRRAYDRLAKHGVPLASNQVEYSLLYRKPETDEVLEACHELNVTLIAYSPLAMGLLTGKYRPGGKPLRRRLMEYIPHNKHKSALPQVLDLLQEIGQAYSKTSAQVALNWLMRQPNVVPIPGAKNAQQAKDNAGALGWEVTEEEAAALDRATEPWKK